MNKPDYLSATFIEQMMRDFAPQQDIRVLDCQPFALDNSASILAVLTAAGSAEARIGHFGVSVMFTSNDEQHTRPLVLKVKPHGDAIVQMLTSLAQACGGQLAEVYPRYQHLTGFQHTHGRELDVYGTLSSELFPEIFGVHADTQNGTYLILMEHLEEVELLNSVMTPDAWTDTHIRQVLRQMAIWHARHLNQNLALNPAYWTDAPSRQYMMELTPLWETLLQNAADKFPDLYDIDCVARLRAVIQDIPNYWQELESMPKTLVHNDLNPRNTCFKLVEGAPSFCVYDWELATYHVPQYDVIELLCFVLDADRYHLRLIYLEFYRNALHELTGLCADKEVFSRGAELAAYDFGLHRLGMYMMAHSVSPYPFLPRVVNSYFDTLTQVRG